jgi:hypothetical protein
MSNLLPILFPPFPHLSLFYKFAVLQILLLPRSASETANDDSLCRKLTVFFLANTVDLRCAYAVRFAKVAISSISLHRSLLYSRFVLSPFDQYGSRLPLFILWIFNCSQAWWTTTLAVQWSSSICLPFCWLTALLTDKFEQAGMDCAFVSAYRVLSNRNLF